MEPTTAVTDDHKNPFPGRHVIESAVDLCNARGWIQPRCWETAEAMTTDKALTATLPKMRRFTVIEFVARNEHVTLRSGKRFRFSR